MSVLQSFTVLHTALSMAAMLVGVGAVAGLFRGGLGNWERIFLALAFATTLTGFLFPIRGATPALIVGAVALGVLCAVAFAGRRVSTSASARTVFAAGLVITLYLLVFVAIAQAFLKIGPLHRLAPTQTEPLFAVVQLAALVAFTWIGVRATSRYRAAGSLPRLDVSRKPGAAT